MVSSCAVLVRFFPSFLHYFLPFCHCSVTIFFQFWFHVSSCVFGTWPHSAFDSYISFLFMKDEKRKGKIGLRINTNFTLSHMKFSVCLLVPLWNDLEFPNWNPLRGKELFKIQWFWMILQDKSQIIASNLKFFFISTTH